MLRRSIAILTATVIAVLVAACRKPQQAPPEGIRPSILLVTLDTTRADALGPEAKNVRTPEYDALVKRGRRFLYAYCTVPQTLPSHSSMMTGLYPAGHGVHENARHLSDNQPVVAERLHAAGYRTAAFVSAFAVARRFGLGRGFDVYDESFGDGRAERTAGETTDRALAYLAQASTQPTFMWVHYYDPHFPYTPPEPFGSEYAKQPYYGEVAYMDQQLGRLVAAFEKQVEGPVAIVIVGDHGEGLGEHGEQQHGDFLYQSTMHVPLLVIGPGVSAGATDVPVSTRRVFHTICDFAGIDATNSLRRSDREVVMGEAMKPFLDYGWQPQVMAVDGPQKTILAGAMETYDVIRDPQETHNLAPNANLSREVRASLRDYPVPSLQSAAAAAPSNDEERRKLAALGYVASDVKPVVRKDAPRPVGMAPLLPVLDEAAGLFVREQYAKAIPLFKQILEKDPYNLDAALRLATSYSSLGRNDDALEAFHKAEAIAPGSPDVRTYLALHYARTNEWQRAAPMLEQIVSEFPDKVPAIEALIVVRERQQRFDDALALRQRLYTLRTPTARELLQTGELAMRLGQTAVAIDAFERARSTEGAAFTNYLELGVLYLASGRFADARDALDRVPPADADYPMALFKRAQVSVLLHEPDAPQRIAAAREHATAVTRALIEHERLFAR